MSKPRPGRFHKAVAVHLAELRQHLFTEHDSDVQRLEMEIDQLKAKLASGPLSPSVSDGTSPHSRLSDSVEAVDHATEVEVESVPGGYLSETAVSRSKVSDMRQSDGNLANGGVLRVASTSSLQKACLSGQPGSREPSTILKSSSSVQQYGGSIHTSSSNPPCGIVALSPIPAKKAQLNPGEDEIRVFTSEGNGGDGGFARSGTNKSIQSNRSSNNAVTKAIGWIGQALNVKGAPMKRSFSSSRSEPRSSRDASSPRNRPVIKKPSKPRASANSESSDDSEDLNGIFGAVRSDDDERLASVTPQVMNKDSEVVMEFKVASAWLKYDNRKSRLGGGRERINSVLDQSAVESAVKAFQEPKKPMTPLNENDGQAKSLAHASLLTTTLTRLDSVVKRDKVQKTLLKLMLQPSSMKHIFWELMGLVLIIYDILSIPMEIFEPPETFLTIVSLWFPCFFWLLDIFVNFCTGYLSPDGTVDMNMYNVARRYARTWLPLDFLLLICNFIALAMHCTPTRDGFEGLCYWRVFTLFRLLHIVRLAKAPEMEGFIAEHIRSEMTRLIASIARIIVVLLVVAHVIACVWYGLGRHIVDRGGTNTWVYRYDVLNKDVWHKYTFSVHWSLALFAGENIAEIDNLAERIFAIIIFIFAFLFSAIFVSSITTLMTRLQIIAGKQSSQLNSLRRYLLDKNISTSLSVRILRNAQHAMQEKGRNLAEASIDLLKTISEPLRVELHFEVYFPVLNSHIFFKYYNNVNPAGIRKVCHHAVSVYTLSTNDIFFSEGETPERPHMLFVISGHLLYYQECSEDITKLERGDWLCEAALWTTWLHYCGTLRGISESSLLSLDAGKFQRILRPFPSAHARQYGELFVNQMNTNARSALTDLPDEDIIFQVAQVFPELDSSTDASWGQVFSLSSRTSKGRSLKKPGGILPLMPSLMPMQ